MAEGDNGVAADRKAGGEDMPITTCPVCEERIVVLRPIPYPIKEIRCPTCRVRLEVINDHPFMVDVFADAHLEAATEQPGAWGTRF
jgi:hypothetical protein